MIKMINTAAIYASSMTPKCLNRPTINTNTTDTTSNTPFNHRRYQAIEKLYPSFNCQAKMVAHHHTYVHRYKQSFVN